ncbi:uncharacterized protein LOC130623513 [Hydractinia symbiolongicarpus]|uniref:uncharacterized protein LOC130623513 n=1 Tax=Hydractinia symbiolongicarpus TaxID=13093 RepID=UPI0025509FC6|nr:uncharacterized protein LOC130623513 [Hydractinia symbiolongicarpus]
MAVRIIDVIRCSSEDPYNPASNLLRKSADSKKWLCAKTNKSDRVEIEFQLEKAVCISFIDLGNYGSHSANILVSHSMRCQEEFVTLIPMFNFMSVQESKQGINKMKVMMFKKINMMADVKERTWDRVKIVCRQPYAIGKQFGLSFLCIKSNEVSPQSEKQEVNNNQNRLNSFFGLFEESPKAFQLPRSSPAQKNRLGSSTKSNLLKHSPVNGENGVIASKKSKPKMISPAAKAQFAEEVDCFLDDIKFDEILNRSELKVSDLRERIENQRGAPLSKHQKRMFMEMITEKLKNNKHLLTKMSKESKSKDSIKSTPPLSDDDIDDVECSTCRIKLPASIISIHTKICAKRAPTATRDTTKNAQTNATQNKQNRNSLCWDMGITSDEENAKSTSKCSFNQEKTLKSSAPITSSLQSQWLSASSNTCARKEWVNRETDLLPIQLSDEEDPIPYTIKTPAKRSSSSSTLNSPNSITDSAMQHLLHTPTAENISIPSRRCSYSARGKRKASGSFADRRRLSSVDNALEIVSLVDSPPGGGIVNNKVSRTKKSNYISLDNEQSTVQSRTNTLQKTNVNKVKKSEVELNHGLNKLKNCKKVENTSDMENIDWSAPKSGITMKSLSAIKTKEQNDTTVTQECPICLMQIEKYRIGIHASVCDGTALDPIPHTNYTEENSYDNVRLVECPLCSKMLDEDIIQVHVNHCLDSSF